MKKLLISMFIAIIPFFLISGSTYPAGQNVLLTFDDGPNPLYTPQVLQTLQENNIQAVFFVVGQEVLKHPDLLADIARHGHLIGVHTFSHRNITEMTRAELRREIQTTAELISRITGQNPVYFRPPRGKHNRAQLDLIYNMGYLPVKWHDCLEKTGVDEPEQLVNDLIKRIRHIPNPVILLHDGDPARYHDRTATVQSLPLLIDRLREKGYGFADPRDSFQLRQVEL